MGNVMRQSGFSVASAFLPRRRNSTVRPSRPAEVPGVHERHNRRRYTTSPRAGFTLLEVILALGLVSILLGAMAAAVDFHFRVVNNTRTRIEEARLARALLDRISRDIRGAVPYDPIDFESLVPGMVTTTSAGDLADLSEEMDFDTDILFGSSSSSASEDGSDLTALTLSHTVPGLYGESEWLQVDVSRLPRPDQLTSEVIFSEDGLLADRVSDVKSVAYFVVDSTNAANYSYSSVPGIGGFEEQGGLVRRQLDRAVTQYASESGLLEAIDQELEPVAPEVAAIEFAYFDGSEWTDTWDSDLEGTLPKAVEVVLYLRRQQTSGAWFGLAGANGSETDEELRSYRTVVYLPAAHTVGELGASAMPASDSGSAVGGGGSGRGGGDNRGGGPRDGRSDGGGGPDSGRPGGGGPPSGGFGNGGGPGGGGPPGGGEPGGGS